MSLQVALATDVGVLPCTFTATLLTKGELVTYEIDGSKREYFLVNVGSEDECATMRVYQKNKLNALKIGKGYTFENIIRTTGDVPFWATSASVIYQSKTMPVSQLARDRASRVPPADNTSRGIHEALDTASTSCVQGVVVNVSL